MADDPGQRSPRAGLVAHQLQLGYGDEPLLRPVDLALRAGELVCLLGPNGAGKSTLLRTLAGLQAPLGGRVSLDGRSYDDFAPRQMARRLAVVLTGGDAPAGLLGAELVRLGRQPHTGWSGRLAPADARAIARAIAQVDGLALAERPLAAMSDGERQKLSIARALAQDAGILLLDEPTAFLDLPRRLETLRILRRAAHEEGRAVLLSTHDLDLALRCADRVWLLAHGRLTVGLPEELVLSGALGEAFAREGIAFDPQEGSFRIERTPRGTAELDGVGDSLDARWLRRALDRLGWQLREVRRGSDPRLESIEHQTFGETSPSRRDLPTVRIRRDGAGWRLERAEEVGVVVDRGTHLASSLREVVAWLDEQSGGSTTISEALDRPRLLVDE